MRCCLMSGFATIAFRIKNFAGETGGGVFKSENQGANWRLVARGLTNRDVEVLTLDPSDSNHIYAGTLGNSLYLSLNAGETWQ
jgi:photosystem II stability/assembly factor-like uncharacterized protein